MKTAAWNRTLYVLLATLYAPENPAVAADAPKAVPIQPAAAESLSPPPKATPSTDYVNIVLKDGAEPLPPPPKPTAYPVAGADGVAKLKAKLESIVLDQVSYDSLPLKDVVESLMKEAAKKDPEKVGVNFLFGQPTEPINRAPAIDPATGLPIAGSSSEVPDLNSVAIRIDPPIKNVRLIDALDAIKRVADTPITYTLEGYAVVLAFDSVRINNGFGVAPSQRPPPPQVVQAQVVAAQTRSFKLDANTFFASVKKLFRRQIDPGSESAGEELRKDVFPRFGVKWNATENIVFYNHITGVLLVRASPEDLDTIQAAIETLGGTAARNAPSDPSLARGGGGGAGGSGGSPTVPTKQ